jgi:hypothetical protein
VAVIPLAAGLCSGSLTNAAQLHPVYRNAMLICAALMVAGAGLAVVFIPARLPAHRPATAAAPEPSPVRTFCDPCAPPIHPVELPGR